MRFGIQVKPKSKQFNSLSQILSIIPISEQQEQEDNFTSSTADHKENDKLQEPILQSRMLSLNIRIPIMLNYHIKLPLPLQKAKPGQI
jgi:hypothetical protein